MNLSEFAFKIIFIFIPGLIAFNIVNKLTFHREFKTLEILLGALTYGFLSYIVYWLVFSFTPIRQFLPIQDIYFLRGLADPRAPLSFQEIALASLLSIPVGLVSSAWINFKCLYWIARKLRISDKVDDIGVWDKAFETSVGDWIAIRDHKQNLMYYGKVDSFSDGLNGNEILLRDVDVFINSGWENKDSKAKLLYSVPGMYVSINENSLHSIEFWSLTSEKYSYNEDMQENVEKPELDNGKDAQ